MAAKLWQKLTFVISWPDQSYVIDRFLYFGSNDWYLSGHHLLLLIDSPSNNHSQFNICFQCPQIPRLTVVIIKPAQNLPYCGQVSFQRYTYAFIDFLLSVVNQQQRMIFAMCSSCCVVAWEFHPQKLHLNHFSWERGYFESNFKMKVSFYLEEYRFTNSIKTFPLRCKNTPKTMGKVTFSKCFNILILWGRVHSVVNFLCYFYL